MIITSLWSYNSMAQSQSKNQVLVNIDLKNIVNDKVNVTLTTPKFNQNEITYHLPKTVPGTYSEDNYGKYIENFKAFDKKGNEIIVNKTDLNSWTITNAKKVVKLTYEVNDTYDQEKGSEFGQGDVFSPAGSNIDVNKNIMLNTHCFVGYFKDYLSTSYKLNVSHIDAFWGATSMTDLDPSNTNDIFEEKDYATLIENPIMYSKPDFTTFKIDGMDILIAVYSPNGMHTAESLTPEMKKMMTAQKKFLGSFNATKKYSVLIYLSDVRQPYDAKGFGALEHPTATTVVMPEIITNEELSEELKDVVSHEFFHIVTPLTIHSKEIQYFDFINPKMSEHLWMYEGVTEYFANLFQINQGLISEDDFYKRMSEKIEHASILNDTLSFTKMSANVLIKPYKDQYLNVYEKGALIGMCLDIIIRDKSNGERGILDLMQKLSIEYGVDRPFEDKDLFNKIIQLTYPEVGEFLTTHVSGSTPINYEKYFAMVGVTPVKVKEYGNALINQATPYITINPENYEVEALPEVSENEFFTSLGIQGGDAILAINNVAYDANNVYDLIISSQAWKNDEDITIKIKRDGKEQVLKGKIVLPYEEVDSFEATDSSKAKLREAWLKG